MINNLKTRFDYKRTQLKNISLGEQAAKGLNDLTFSINNKFALCSVDKNLKPYELNVYKQKRPLHKSAFYKNISHIAINWKWIIEIGFHTNWGWLHTYIQKYLYICKTYQHERPKQCPDVSSQQKAQVTMDNDKWKSVSMTMTVDRRADRERVKERRLQICKCCKNVSYIVLVVGI